MVLAASAPMLAQVAPYGEKTMGDPAQDHLPDILTTAWASNCLSTHHSATKPAKRSSWAITSARSR
jgi:hypothetical protein